MRNANAQCTNTMIRVGAMRQPPAPHVSHAETGGWRSRRIASIRRAAPAGEQFEAPLEKTAKIPPWFG
jgi:hypothetical protein